jgi:hypothetical protein
MLFLPWLVGNPDTFLKVESEKRKEKKTTGNFCLSPSEGQQCVKPIV